MTRRLLLSVFLVSVLVSGVAIAQELPQRTLRRHTSVRDANQETLFLITEIMHVDPERTENTVLIEDETQHERFIYRTGFEPLKSDRSSSSATTAESSSSDACTTSISRRR